MTQRSILAGPTPNVEIRASGDVSIEGWDSDRVQADADSRWGLKVERRSAAEIARARAKVGDHVLLDVRLKVKNPLKKDVRDEVTDVQIGRSGKVYVPLNSRVKVYADKSVDVQNIRGSVAVYAGRDVRIRNVHSLVHLSAGRSIDFECEEVEGDNVKFSAGRDLRCYIQSLTDARFMINDLGGPWEAVIGDGRTKIRLDSGGDVTLVTDRAIVSQSPYDTLGRIERPSQTGSEPAKKE